MDTVVIHAAHHIALLLASPCSVGWMVNERPLDSHVDSDPILSYPLTLFYSVE